MPRMTEGEVFDNDDLCYMINVSLDMHYVLRSRQVCMTTNSYQPCIHIRPPDIIPVYHARLYLHIKTH